MNLLDLELQTVVKNEGLLIDEGDSKLMTTMAPYLGSEESGGRHSHFSCRLQDSLFFFCSCSNTNYSLLSFPKPESK